MNFSRQPQLSSPSQVHEPRASVIGSSWYFLWRAPCVLALLIAAMVESLVRGKESDETPLTVAKWTRRILRVANVELTLEGRIPDAPGLFVSNHRSYIDILVILAHVPATFLCKREVGKWPIVGTVARNMGVVFVDRRDTASRLASLERVSATVLDGRRLVAFPEGTTTRGPSMRPTYPGLFREAERKSFDLFPMVIEYADADDAWVGDDTLMRHLVYWLSKPTTRVKLSFGAPVEPDQTGAAQQRTEAWMRETLHRLNQHRW